MVVRGVQNRISEFWISKIFGYLISLSESVSEFSDIQVRHSSYHGIAHGIARGGVPSARIAIYKVCGPTGCDYTDILSAFEQAIADGVDIISISLGNDGPLELTFDPIAIGAFHTIKGAF
ncbi:putative tripeptidyl-peptidase II [Helianthus annuus]|nr:putative tripeptidyl-peptidase II [Helianthus annuus]